MKHMAIVLTLILILPFLTQAVEITDGLVLYMPLDEGTGDKTEDESKTNVEGEVKGAKWVDGKFGKALQFKSSAEHVLVPDNKAFHIKGEITQAAWIWLDRLLSAHAIVFGTRMGGGGRDIGFGYGMIREMASKSGLMARAVGSWILTTIKPALKPKQWYHLAYTHTDADNKLV